MCGWATEFGFPVPVTGPWGGARGRNVEGPSPPSITPSEADFLAEAMLEQFTGLGAEESPLVPSPGPRGRAAGGGPWLACAVADFEVWREALGETRAAMRRRRKTPPPRTEAAHSSTVSERRARKGRRANRPGTSF